MNKDQESPEGSKPVKDMTFSASQRIATIDILRAFTMVLMIFVNELCIPGEWDNNCLDFLQFS